ncbi:MAG: amidohydrolase family protein [Actinomycetota bacterium]
MRYEIISADTHILEPPDIWKNHLAKPFQEHAPTLVKDHEGGDAWQFVGGDPDPIGLVSTPGKRFEDFAWHGVTYDSIRPACYIGKERLVDMDIDGIDAEVHFPPQRTIGHWLGYPDPEVSLAGIDAYNDFLWNEWMAPDRERLVGLMQIPNIDVETGVKYLRRSKEIGFKGVVISSWPTGGEDISEEDDAFWAAAQELDIPVSIHIRLMSRGVGVKAFERGKATSPGVSDRTAKQKQKAVGGLASVFKDTPPIIGQFIFSGVFDRFPKLRVIFIETGVGWIPHFLEQMDDRYWRNRGWGGVELKREPSYYWFNNFAATFMVDFNGVQNRYACGVDNIMWSTDYPHHGNDFPYSRKLINEMFVGVDQDERYRILAGNAVRLWHLDGS